MRQDWADDGKGGTSLGFGAVVQHASFVLADFVYLHSRDPARYYNPSFENALPLHVPHSFELRSFVATALVSWILTTRLA